MEIKRKAVIDDKEKAKLYNRAFYLSEAFFRTGDSAQSMNTLVSKVMNAKSITEITEIYKQYNIDYHAFGRDAFQLEIAVRDYYMEQEGFDDPTPLYAKWLYYMVRSASACLDLYRVCLRVVRQEANQSAVVNIMDMLDFAYKAFI